MNPQTNGAARPGAISGARQFYWSVRRELWENRSIYVAPLGAAAVVLFAFLIGVGFLPGKIRAAQAAGLMRQHELIAQPYTFAAMLIMATTFVVGILYCLDALYGERRDRSILFWKSLPVSDLTTVLAKASIAIVVLPVLTFAITIATQWIMLLLSTTVLMASGLSVEKLWTDFSPLAMWLMLFYHLLAVHALWYAPVYCWLLLASAWARRAPFLWALVPPAAIYVVEKTAFGTSHFVGMLSPRLGGGAEGSAFMQGPMSMESVAHLNPIQFLVSPGLWTGLAVAAVFLAGAVRLRRYREPI